MKRKYVRRGATKKPVVAAVIATRVPDKLEMRVKRAEQRITELQGEHAEVLDRLYRLELQIATPKTA